MEEIRNFLLRALEQREKAQELILQLPPGPERWYARGLSDGMEEACKEVLAYIDTLK